MRFIMLMLLVMLSGGAWAGPYDDAKAAYERGDYATALTIIRPLAAKGEAWAQCGMWAGCESAEIDPPSGGG